jgi:hypothetical protein
MTRTRTSRRRRRRRDENLDSKVLPDNGVGALRGHKSKSCDLNHILYHRIVVTFYPTLCGRLFRAMSLYLSRT